MKKLTSIILFIAICFVFLTGCTPKYKLTIDENKDILYEQPQKYYEKGEKVVIKTHIVYDADVRCFVNGKSIGIQTAIKTGDNYTHWEYYFEMPAENVTVEFEFVSND